TGKAWVKPCLAVFHQSVRRHAVLGHGRFRHIAPTHAYQADALTDLQLSGVVGMTVIEFELRLHELIRPTTQGDVRVAEQVGIDRAYHACDLKALALELLISSHGVALIGLSQLLSTHFKQGCNRGFHSCRLTLVS